MCFVSSKRRRLIRSERTRSFESFGSALMARFRIGLFLLLLHLRLVFIVRIHKPKRLLLHLAVIFDPRMFEDLFQSSTFRRIDTHEAFDEIDRLLRNTSPELGRKIVATFDYLTFETARCVLLREWRIADQTYVEDDAKRPVVDLVRV